MSDDGPKTEKTQTLVFADRYELTDVLGRGGMGEVSRAYDTELRRVVAIKRLHTAKGEPDTQRARLLKEARAAAQLNHPNVINVFDVGEADGEGFVIMEHVHGGSLQQRMTSGDPWSTAQALDWLTQLADALACAHEAGLVHRDIKPPNLLLGPAGQIKVADFGIAKEVSPAVALADMPPLSMRAPMTHEGHVVGTPRYMAPEQLRAGAVDGRVDQFAWGIVAYQLLTGEHPYDIGSEPVTAQQVADGLFVPPPFPRRGPEVAPEIERVVLRALSFDPGARFPNMRALLSALDAARPQSSRDVTVRSTSRAVGSGTLPMSAATTKTVPGEVDTTVEVPSSDGAAGDTEIAPPAHGRPRAVTAPPPPPVRRVAPSRRLLAFGVGALALATVAAGVLVVRARRVAATIASASASGSVAAPAALAPVEMCGTDGRVDALAVAGDKLFAAGDVEGVVCPSGSGVRFDAKTGALLPTPVFAGTVRAALADPERPGGYFVGGEFTKVGGRDAPYLVRLLPDGTLDPGWSLAIDGAVRTLAYAGGTLYVGGAFRTVGGVAHDHIAAIDLASRSLTAFTATPDVAVDVLGVWGDTLYVCGFVDEISGVKMTSVAALDRRTGKVTGWRPRPDERVDTMLVDGGRVYLAGRFKNIGGARRDGLAAFDASTGALLPWRPDVDGGAVTGIGASGGRVFLGGRFSRISGDVGLRRARFVAVDRSSGRREAFRGPEPRPVVSTFTSAAGLLYVGGSIDKVGDAARGHGAAFDLSTDALTTFDPAVSEDILTIAAGGDSVFVGGEFSGAARRARKGLVAFDARTGKPHAFGVTLDAAASALTVADGQVYIGGAFDRVAGVERHGFAVVDAESGAVSPRAASVEIGWVESIAVAGERVLLGGNFEAVGGVARAGVAKLDGAGLVASFVPDIRPIKVAAVALAGDRVFVGGQFTDVDGKPQKGLAALDGTTGRALPFPSVEGTVQRLVVHGERLFVCGDFTSIGGKPHRHLAAVALDGRVMDTRVDALMERSCDAITVGGSVVYAATRDGVTAFDVASGTYLPFKAPVDMTGALALSGTALYAAGRFQYVGDLPRANLVAIDARTGAPR